jgi:hypothetical protein
MKASWLVKNRGLLHTDAEIVLVIASSWAHANARKHNRVAHTKAHAQACGTHERTHMRHTRTLAHTRTWHVRARTHQHVDALISCLPC